MTLWRSIAVGTALLLWGLGLGFFVFVANVMRTPSAEIGAADGIVVLTGGQLRIQEGASLLKRGLAERMLITGVNLQVRQDELQRLSGLDRAKFSCCVDLGYTALDTIGNAQETRTWAAARSYDSLIVVTANYHMPRSLVELSRVLPGTRLIPHPVTPPAFDREVWWLSPVTTLNLVAEYAKFLPSAARYAVHRALGATAADSIAEAHGPAAPNT